MKKFKKLVAVMLAAIMVMAMGVVSVSAATTYTITIDNSTTGYSYAAYQIFKGDLSTDETTLSNIDWGSGIDSTKISDLLTALKKIAVDGTIGDVAASDSPFKDCNDAKSVAEALSKYTITDNVIAQAFAQVVAGYLTTTANGTTSTLTSSSNYQITDLDAGYYLVMTTDVPESNSEDTDAYTRYILEVVKNVTVTEKKSVPTVTKTADNQDVYIGETVNFTLTATMPSTYADYDTYKLIFHDTLSEGLTYADSLKVKVYNYDEATGLNEFATGVTYYTYDTTTDTYVVVTGAFSNQNTYYTLVGTEVNSGSAFDPVYTVASGITEFAEGVTYYTYDGNDYTIVGATETFDGNKAYYTITSFNVTLADTNKLYDSASDLISVSKYSVIEVTYATTVNSNADTGNDGSSSNKNSVSLEYSNNPNSGGEGSTGTTTTEEVPLFTFELDLTKVDGTTISTTLAGAEFNLKNSSGNYLVATDNGNGSYTVTGWSAKEDDATTFVSPTNGTIKITGLASGTYTLIETKAPDGYNLLADNVSIVINASYSDSDNDGVMDSVSSLTINIDSTGAENGNAATGVVSGQIKNNKGSNIPSTGGMGTTILYIIGAILVIGAAVILVTRRRMANRT